MARTNDPQSATAQFFINTVDNPGLDYPKPDGNGYAVFGEVISGMDVVDKIAAVKTGNKGGHQDVPLTPVEVTSARRIGAEIVFFSSAALFSNGFLPCLLPPLRIARHGGCLAVGFRYRYQALLMSDV